MRADLRPSRAVVLLCTAVLATGLQAALAQDESGGVTLSGVAIDAADDAARTAATMLGDSVGIRTVLRVDTKAGTVVR